MATGTRRAQEILGNRIAFDQIKNQKIPQLEQSIATITKRQGDYNQQIDKLIQEIKTKGEELKREIDEIQNKLIDELMQQATQDQTCLKEIKEEMDKKLRTMKDLLIEHEEMVQKFSDIDIIVKAGNIKDTLSQLSSHFTLPTVRPPTFKTGQIKDKDLKCMYGQVIFKSDQSPVGPLGEKDKAEESKLDKSPIDPHREKHTKQESKAQGDRIIQGNIVTSFKWRENLGRIKMLNHNEAWMVELSGRNLQLVNHHGKIIKSITTDFGIFDMSITKSGDVLVTTGNNHIKQVSASGDIVTFADLSPYRTLAIHVTQNGDVLVGLCDRRGSRVTRLSSQGQTLQMIEEKINKDVYLYMPYRITENINGDIVIINIWDYIIVTDRHGKYRFKYTGPTGIKMANKFTPWDIICNQNGQILVADQANHAIHLLDKDGVFIQYILTQQGGLEKPRALAMDGTGNLWIGCVDGKVLIVD